MSDPIDTYTTPHQNPAMTLGPKHHFSVLWTTRTAIVLLGIVTTGCLVNQRSSQERSIEAWFIRQNTSYYSNLAHTCDELLKSRSLPDNSWYFVDLQKSRPPKLIADLHPRELLLTSSTVSIGYSAGNDSFWIGWGPGGANTNLWTLEANLKDGRKTFYAETRKPSS